MTTYILNVIAQHGHEDAVAELFQSLQSKLEKADGFGSRTIYRAQAGVFLDTVKSIYTKEELENIVNQEVPGPDGVHFMIHETWDSPEQRIRFSHDVEGQFLGQLIPHLLPNHSHEFYEAV